MIIDRDKIDDIKDHARQRRQRFKNEFSQIAHANRARQRQQKLKNNSPYRAPRITLANLISVCKALFTGTGVSTNRRIKRLEICRECEYFRYCEKHKRARCGICGCRVDLSALINLAKYKETDRYGCKHPEGSRWQASGV